MSTVLSNYNCLDVFLASLEIRSPSLRKSILELVQPVGVEFHKDLFAILRQFHTADLERFIKLWSKVDVSMRSAFVAFIVTGDDPDGRFLSYLDQNKDCQEAVDLAFTAHIESLHDFGRSLSEAEKVVADNEASEIVSLLSEAEKAEEALESAEETLEHLTCENSIGGVSLQPILESVHTALCALGGTTRGLRTLCRK